MASFYAELEVSGHTYPVRACQFSFTQAIDARGRVREKVRHGLVQLSLDTPHDDFLLHWGTTAHKPLAGHVTFFAINWRTAHETMSFAAGECVGYHETFEAGDGGAGAYVCHLTIAAPQLVLSAGGPLRPFVAAKAREYAAQLPNKLRNQPIVEAKARNDAPQLTNAPRRWSGGAGPDGEGDTIGKFSGRRFDPDNCGGPILQLDWRNTVISEEGIRRVQKHVNRFGEDPENQAMIERLVRISNGNLVASDWDKRFYTHELREYERYQALGIADGVDPGREVWNNTHTATLEDYGLSDVSDGVHNLYHPDI